MDSGETPRATCFQASTDQGEAMSRQVSAPVPPRGDSPPDKANLIRELMREELRRGLGRRSHCSEREGSVSSLSQEGSRSSCSCLVRRSRSPSSLCQSRSSSRRLHCSHAPSRSSHVSGGSSHSPAHVSCRATPRLLLVERHRRLLLRLSLSMHILAPCRVLLLASCCRSSHR